jgi:hypothetical protein
MFDFGMESSSSWWQKAAETDGYKWYVFDTSLRMPLSSKQVLEVVRGSLEVTISLRELAPHPYQGQQALWNQYFEPCGYVCQWHIIQQILDCCRGLDADQDGL